MYKKTIFFHVLSKLVKISKLIDNFIYLDIKHNHFINSCYTCLIRDYLADILLEFENPSVELNFDRNDRKTVYNKIFDTCKYLNVSLKSKTTYYDRLNVFFFNFLK